MKTATKRDLVVKISNETGMTQQQVFDVIQKTLDTITQTLAAGDEVVLRNFGSFQVKETKQKIGRNPNKPGTDVVIPPRAVILRSTSDPRLLASSGDTVAVEVIPRTSNS